MTRSPINFILSARLVLSLWVHKKLLIKDMQLIANFAKKFSKDHDAKKIEFYEDNENINHEYTADIKILENMGIINLTHCCNRCQACGEHHKFQQVVQFCPCEPYRFVK